MKVKMMIRWREFHLVCHSLIFNKNGSEGDACHYCLITTKPSYEIYLINSTRFYSSLRSGYKRNNTVPDEVKCPILKELVRDPVIVSTGQKIPAHISIVFPKTITLRDKYKNIWQVEARNVDGLLDVNIVGPNGDIKAGVGYRKIDNPNEHQNTESDENEDVDTIERVSSDFVKYNSFNAKRKRGKEVCKYQDDTDEYEADDDFAGDGGQGYWDGEGDDGSEESDSFELVNDKCKEVGKKLRKSKNDNNARGSRKPQQRKRNVDCLGKGILKSGLASKLKGSSSVKRMNPLYRNGLKRGKGAWIKDSEDEEGDSGDESIELILRNDQKGKGRVEKKLKEDVRTFNAPKSMKHGMRVDYLGKDIFGSGQIPWPECKYFVTKVNPRRMDELHIPKDILNDENLEIPEMINLVDPNGDTYNSELKKWKDGRMFYKGGFSRLCRKNFLTKDDFCIVEFGEEDQAGFLYVSFLRRAHS